MTITLSQVLTGGLLVLAVFQANAQVTCTVENTAVPATTPTTNFTLHNDGTATHNTTGLVWMRCSLGQTWDGTSCSGSAKRYSWSIAQRQGGTRFADSISWRLPNIIELHSILERRCDGPSINAAIFPNTPSDWFWSSSSFANDSDSAWSVNFDNGDEGVGKKSGYDHVRLVRSGQ